jgi:hypothetical protein
MMGEEMMESIEPLRNGFQVPTESGSEGGRFDFLIKLSFLYNNN